MHFMEAKLFAPNCAWARYTRLLAMGAALSVMGCAGTNVDKVTRQAPNASLARPRTVAVIVEDDSPAPERVSRREAQHADAQQAAAGLSKSISKLLTSRQLSVVPAGMPADLILRCRILDVRGGSEALRVLVGYGAGKAVLQVGVTLNAGEAGISPRTEDGPSLLSFETKSTTGRMPGAGLGVASGIGSGSAMAIAGSATGIPGAMKQGLSQEVSQTTDHIDQELGKYFMAQNWPYTKPVSTSLGGWADRL